MLTGVFGMPLVEDTGLLLVVAKSSEIVIRISTKQSYIHNS